MIKYSKRQESATLRRMNLILLSGAVPTPAAVHLLVEHRLAAFAARQTIAEATVRLRDDREASPRFHASVALRIPGPDMHASACDHTVHGAVRRALDLVEAQIVTRQSRRQARRRSNLQLPASARAGRSW